MLFVPDLSLGYFQVDGLKREIDLTSKFVLRSMVPSDGPALSILYQASPDTGRIQIAPRYHLDAYVAFAAVRPRATGVVAEMDGFEGLVGAGFVDFGRCSFEGELRDYASLSGVVVHPDFRRKGIASRLAQWRVEFAREHIGDRGVILTNIQEQNIGSFAVAKKWSRQFVGQVTTGAVSMRKKMPEKISGITVRRAERHEFEAVAAGFNNFYHNYNLYEPQSAESLREWLEQSPF